MFISGCFDNCIFRGVIIRLPERVNEVMCPLIYAPIDLLIGLTLGNTCEGLDGNTCEGLDANRCLYSDI